MRWVFLAVVLLLGCLQERMGEGLVPVEDSLAFFENNDTVFLIGDAKPVEDEQTRIPEVSGAEIYDFIIFDEWDNFAKPSPALKKDFTNLSKYAGKKYFFAGHQILYTVPYLKTHNPNIEWLNYISMGHISVFIIDYADEVEDDEEILTLTGPKKYSDNMVMSVIVNNTSGLNLQDSHMYISVEPTKFKFSNVDRSQFLRQNSTLSSSSYYTLTVTDRNLTKNKQKKYSFQINTRNTSMDDIWMLKNLTITTTFKGYHKSPGDERLYQPVYSQKKLTYKTTT